MKNNLILVLLITFIYSIAENPSSENYILQQSSVSTGNDPANPPTSENYILKSSAVMTITGDEQTSENYANFPSYYLGDITAREILAPENVSISINGGNIYLQWNASDGVNSYEIYSSTDPNLAPESWNLVQTGI